MWFWPSSVYYVSRSLESGHALFFVLAGVIIIAILAYKRPPHWIAWSAVVGMAQGPSCGLAASRR